MTFFIIGVFGRKNETLERLPKMEVILLKISLSSIVSGALFNILTLSTPSKSEIFMSFGLGLLFVWAALFHWKYFVKSKK